MLYNIECVVVNYHQYQNKSKTNVYRTKVPMFHLFLMCKLKVHVWKSKQKFGEQKIKELYDNY